MNEQVDNVAYEFLWKLLADPADPNRSYISDLQSLVNEYPQSGLLRALLVPDGDNQYLKHAAAYFDPRVVHQLATAPDNLAIVTADQIVFSGEAVAFVDDTIESPTEETHNNTFSLSEPVADVVEPDYATGTPIEDEPVHEEIAEAPIIEQVEETETSEENSLAKQYDAYLAESEAAPVSPVSSYEEEGDRYFHQAIDDDVFDEIVSIEDINLEQLAILNKSVNDEEKEESYFVFETEIAETTQPTTEQTTAENPVATQTDLHPAVITERPIAQQTYSFADEKSSLSKYNDEKMPYTFMWWLDKTRKEHAAVYQPYISRSVPAPSERSVQPGALDELQQQYYQNIVSETSITDLDKNPPKAPVSSRKESQIIERFIHEEPHMKHPSGAKLDNENKAKRSSEDKEELVTETLARIYTEQMLYHKAILTYKKLMLKYPEKSLYFAGQIEQLESKIN